MDKELNNIFQDESEDAILARIEEESLRYYNEVELPRRAAESRGEPEVLLRTEDLNNSAHELRCSTNIDPSQGTPVKDVFYQGTGEGAEGFHLAAGETYVYPTNYPVRKYQKNIIHSALFHNTLVSLPTGLGKTFIAAVVMYNYYRWFPQGKIVFMAPTRPLVAQQIRACHDIMAIPIKDTIEMTGNMNPVDRLSHWKTKRVFFLTPQVMANDLRSGVCPAKLFKCVVIDEAHRATKEYAYCHVIRELEKAGAVFRVLALSATPGSNIKAVTEVVQNLRISTLELRGEDSPDVAPYTHAKQIEPISLNLSKNITDFREKFLLIFERYARNLRQSRLITCNVQNITKFQLLKASDKLRSRPPNGMTKAKMGVIMSDFTVCMTLAHGLDLLQTYGLRAFYQYFTVGDDEENRKAAFTRLRQDAEFHELLNNLHNDLSAPQDQFWSHPKHENLVKILQDHFSQAEKRGEDTKVIVFCQYRVVVSEIYDLLQKIHPLIKPAMFIGQGVGKDKKGLPQKKQIEIMKQFRDGRSNVLIATCVAEEGLDIGSVDLLVLMEGQRSPVRLVQRLGRTGRHRSGRCVVLLTHGKEVQKFNEAMASRKSFLTTIQNSKVLEANLYKDDPSMVPSHLMPRIQLVHVNVPERITPGKTKKQRDIRQALLPKLNDTKEDGESGILPPEHIALLKEELSSLQINYNSLTFHQSEFLFHRMNEPAMSSEEVFKDTFCQQSEYNDWNRVPQQTFLLSHSVDSEMLSHLLKKSETMQIGQHEDLNSQMNISNTLFNKKKPIKNKVKPNMEKRVKTDREERHGMDIRECMAFAADKARLTQDKYLLEDCKELDERAPLEVSIHSLSPIPSQCEQMDISTNDSLPSELDCPQCKQLFLVSCKFNNMLTNNNQQISFTENDFAGVENLIESLTKEIVDNINVSKIFASDPGSSIKDIKESINNRKQSVQLAINNTSSFDVFETNEIAKTKCEFPSNLSPCRSDMSSVVNKVNKLSPGKISSHNNFLNIQNNFNDDDELNFSFLERKTKTSTPIRKQRSTTNEKPIEDWVKSIPNPGIKSIDKVNKSIHPLNHDIVELFSPNKSLFSSTTLKVPCSNQPVFKIPQLKLNFETIRSPSRPIRSIKPVSPESPILSGQISSQKPISPESPILSGQILSQKSVNPESPILSGQISSHQIRPSSPKLGRKVLFCDDVKVKEIHITHSQKTEDKQEEEEDMLSVSQLFDDDDSNERTKAEPLDQSSMYTISQMVAKVSELTNKKESMNSMSDQNDVKNKSNHISFGNCDEDSLFDQINLNSFSTKKDTFTSSKRINTMEGVNKLQEFDSDSTDCGILDENVNIDSSNKENPKKKEHLDESPNSTKSFHANHSFNTTAQEITQLDENSFITSRWLSCMKSPKQQPKLKTSTPLTLTRNELRGLSDSDSSPDVFQIPLARKKSSKPIANQKTGKKDSKHKKLFLELEADVSGPPGSSDEENTSGLDDLDESFINDMTEQPSTSINRTVLDIQAQYLQSVKSPLRKPGGYKIPVVSRSIMAKDVFSQAVEQDDSYENDSFCCGSTEMDSEGEASQSLLEIAEQLLDKNTGHRRKKKKRRVEFESSSDSQTMQLKSRKKRAFICSESSNESSGDDSTNLNRSLKRKRLLTSDSSPEDQLTKVKMKRKRKKQTHLLTSDSES